MKTDTKQFIFDSKIIRYKCNYWDAGLGIMKVEIDDNICFNDNFTAFMEDLVVFYEINLN